MGVLRLIGRRPASLAEVARRANSGETFDPLVREFLDSFYLFETRARIESTRDAPDRVGPIHDAYLAAVAEHLCLRHRLPTPLWTEGPERFLHEPHFAGGLESLKAILLAESPLAFRRRAIFVSRDALSRPRDPALCEDAPASATTV